MVRKNGMAWRKVGEPPCHSDLVALKNSRITLDRLHQRAGFTLLGSAALAKAAATQSLSELIDALGWRREIVRRIEVGIQGQIGFDPLEPRDHTGERAHMLSETRHGRPRRYGPVSSARHNQLGAGAKLDRHRYSAPVPQLFAAAGRTLRAGRHRMLHNTRAQQIVTDDVIVQLGAKASSDRFGNFEGSKLNRALSERV